MTSQQIIELMEDLEKYWHHIECIKEEVCLCNKKRIELLKKWILAKE